MADSSPIETFDQAIAFLLDLVRDMNPEKSMKIFDMRARAPLFDTAPFTVCGRPTDEGCEVWAATPEGTVAMQARVTFA